MLLKEMHPFFFFSGLTRKIFVLLKNELFCFFGKEGAFV